MVVSFSLWDLVGYTLEHILGDVIIKSEVYLRPEKSERFIETSQRFYPVMNMKEGYTIFRPSIRYNGNTVLERIEQIGIQILSIPCDFKEYRPKRILVIYYEKMKLKFDYDRLFQFAKEVLDLPDITSYATIEKEKYFSDAF